MAVSEAAVTILTVGTTCGEADILHSELSWWTGLFRSITRESLYLLTEYITTTAEQTPDIRPNLNHGREEGRCRKKSLLSRLGFGGETAASSFLPKSILGKHLGLSGTSVGRNLDLVKRSFLGHWRRVLRFLSRRDLTR